jgi:hypothetical protein
MITPIKAGEKPLGIGLEKALATGCRRSSPDGAPASSAPI